MRVSPRGLITQTKRPSVSTPYAPRMRNEARLRLPEVASKAASSPFWKNVAQTVPAEVATAPIPASRRVAVTRPVAASTVTSRPE
jgi:hypothetical protein